MHVHRYQLVIVHVSLLEKGMETAEVSNPSESFDPQEITKLYCFKVPYLSIPRMGGVRLSSPLQCF